MATNSMNLDHAEAVNRFLEEDLALCTRRFAEIEVAVRDDETPHSKEYLDRVDVAIDDLRRACAELEIQIGEDPDLIRTTQASIREAIAPWFSQSWFMNRATAKPKGYPGDFVILSALYDGLPKSTGIGGYLDRYFLGTELGRAVPGRMRAVKKFLVEEVAQREGEVSILNIACGPCREYVDGFEHSQNVSPVITCVDSDEETLEFVANSVASAGNGAPELKCVKHNALRIASAKRNIAKFGRPDIIYSVGLFDYIPDRLLIPMLKGLKDTVAEGGILYLAFKDANAYDKIVYQWMVDWHFYQRTVEDCRELYRQAGFDVDAMEMTRDDTGIIVNFINRMPAGVQYRVDAAQSTTEPQQEANQPERLPSRK